MSARPLISVIIPAYNHEKYIATTIKSLLAQTYPNIELLIIDDGSQDKTLDIIRFFGKKCCTRFVRFEYATQSNAGTCETLNRLMAMVRGKYVYLIASDDVAKPQALERLCTFLESNPDYAMAVGDNEFINEKGEAICWNKDNNPRLKENENFPTYYSYFKVYRKSVNFFSEEFGRYESLIQGNYIPNGYLLRKEVLDTIEPFTKQAPLEDLYMLLQIARLGRMKYLNEVLFSYRCHASNASKNRDKMQLITIKTINYIRKKFGEEHLMIVPWVENYHPITKEPLSK